MFKKCSGCSGTWRSGAEFLSDPAVTLVGYQVNFGALELGALLFNHVVAGCGSTISLEAGRFRDLYNGPVFEERLTGSSPCPGYCLRQGDLDPCPARCECAYVRDILQIVKQWPKRMAGVA